MNKLSAITDATEIVQLEREYRETLSQYRKRFGIAAAMSINEKLTLRSWYGSKSHQEFVAELISEMKREMGNE